MSWLFQSFGEENVGEFKLATAIILHYTVYVISLGSGDGSYCHCVGIVVDEINEHWLIEFKSPLYSSAKLYISYFFNSFI